MPRAAAAAVAALVLAAELHDAHFHLTSYVQEGPPVQDFLELMGERVGRVAIFGIPLQQTCSL